MSTEERYDFIIVGGGPNGVTLAAYLAKCGLSVCVLEERPEAGGAVENTEPIAGVHINPHAIMMYGAPAPGFEQLELWKYGYRCGRSQYGDLTRGENQAVATTEGPAPVSQRDMMGYAKISGLLGQPPFIKDLLRATFWCPPHPPEVEVTAENIPYMQVYKQHQPDMWTEELLEMTMFDLMDEHLDTEPLKAQQAIIAWYSGAAGHWQGVAIPAWCCNITLNVYGQMRVPRGGMHDFFHAIMRCALAHGAVVRTCCPVDEIIVNDSTAVGVRLRETATCGEKRIWAQKAVISGVDIQQTFLRLIGPQHLDVGFMQRIKDISIKGGSIYVSHFLTREPLRKKAKFGDMPVGVVYPMDSREIYYEHVADVDGRKGNPTMPPERVIWILSGSERFDPTDPQCTIPGRYLESPGYLYVPPPEYHVDGPDAVNRFKDEINAYVRKAMSEVFENVNSDNLVYHWANSPYDSEFRNTGLIGGTWCGTRHGRDQWAEKRPLPELSRYRTPIDGLYLCNQTSGHPGGLCLMAIPYNLMHIMIEDGLVEPGDWWYPSPWYIPQQGKISAIPG